MQKQSLGEKTVLKNLAEFTGECLWHSLFFNKITSGVPKTLSKKTPAHVVFRKFCKTTVKNCLYKSLNSHFFFIPNFENDGFVI